MEDEYARLYRRAEQKRRRRRRRRAGFVVALALVGSAGYVTHLVRNGETHSGGNSAPRAPTTIGSSERATTSRTAQTQVAQPKPNPQPLLSEADESSFRSLERSLDGVSGIALSSVGLKRPIIELGALRDAVAWSTIKVPIALAVEAQAAGHPSSSEQALLTRAITESDNAAAEELWSGLGPPNEASAAVQEVLAATGDRATTVETRVLRPGFTSFGQTRWSLAAQQRFIAGLPCLPYSRPVRSLMKQVVPSQRWGLGAVAGDAEVKGGWGPDAQGRYLVRQIGIVSLGNGRRVAASIATIPADGSFQTGTSNVTEIAVWLVDHVNDAAVEPTPCA
jgi:hypothetical protein